GRVLLLEPVWRGEAASDGVASDDVARLMDLKMLVLGHGRVRNRHQLRELFQRSGWRLTRIIPSPMIAVVEGRPAD
ncbi:hypothetical protein, partial [Jatrophihabitans sp.]|uniref:hypothetical protein n=1 Tax=Jatrophihabitans sp. TaxID=1932789 RepID=UPI0030C6DD0D|nr:O-methyltransferase domain [Jatrophihabitans sp.]